MSGAGLTEMDDRGRDVGRPAPVSHAAARAAVRVILDEVGAPLPARVLADLARVLEGVDLSRQRIASWPAHNVTAAARGAPRADALEWPVNAVTYEAIVDLVAPTAWLPVRKIVGGRTQRVGHLRVVLVVARAWERGRRDDAVVTTLRAYGGALPGARTADGRLDVTAIVREATTELTVIVGPEQEERVRSARAR